MKFSRVLLCLGLLWWASVGVRATDITISEMTINGFYPTSATSLMTGTCNTSGTTVTLVSGITAQPYRSPGSPGWPQYIRVKIGNSYYKIASVESATSFTLTESAGTQTGASITVYPFVELRIYALSSFTPPELTTIIQQGAPGSTAWYQRYGVSIINNVAYLPAITLTATTDAPNNQEALSARWYAGFYAGNTFIQEFQQGFRLPATPTSTTWPAIRQANAPNTNVQRLNYEAYNQTQTQALVNALSGTTSPSYRLGQQVSALLPGIYYSILAGTGLNPPTVRYNTDTSRWEWSNDGLAFNSMLGIGGGSGTQYTLPVFGTTGVLNNSMFSQNAGATSATISGAVEIAGAANLSGGVAISGNAAATRNSVTVDFYGGGLGRHAASHAGASDAAKILAALNASSRGAVWMTPELSSATSSPSTWIAGPVLADVRQGAAYDSLANMNSAYQGGLALARKLDRNFVYTGQTPAILNLSAHWQCCGVNDVLLGGKTNYTGLFMNILQQSIGQGNGYSVEYRKNGNGDMQGMVSVLFWQGVGDAGGDEGPIVFRGHAEQNNELLSGTVGSKTGNAITLSSSSNAKGTGVGRLLINTTPAKIYSAGSVTGFSGTPSQVSFIGTTLTSLGSGLVSNLCFFMDTDTTQYGVKMVDKIKSIDDNTHITLTGNVGGNAYAWPRPYSDYVASGTTTYKICKCSTVTEISDTAITVANAADFAASDTVESPLSWGGRFIGGYITYQQRLPNPIGSSGFGINNLGNLPISYGYVLSGPHGVGFEVNGTIRDALINVDSQVGTNGRGPLISYVPGTDYVNIFNSLNSGATSTSQFRYEKNTDRFTFINNATGPMAVHVSASAPEFRLTNTGASGKTGTITTGTSGTGFGTPAKPSQLLINDAAPNGALHLGAGGGGRLEVALTEGILAAGGNNLLLRTDSNGTVGNYLKLQGFNGSAWQDVIQIPNAASGNVPLALTPNGGAATFGGILGIAGDLTVTSGDVIAATAGKTIKIKTGTNACHGTNTLAAGTVTVATTCIATGDRVFLTHQTVGGTQGILSLGTVTNNTSFVINSSTAADTGTVAWWIIKPAP